MKTIAAFGLLALTALSLGACDNGSKPAATTTASSASATPATTAAAPATAASAKSGSGW